MKQMRNNKVLPSETFSDSLSNFDHCCLCFIQNCFLLLANLPFKSWTGRRQLERIWMVIDEILKLQ